MAIIKVNTRIDNNFGKTIFCLFELMDEIENKKSEDKIELDFSQSNVSHPFFTLPVLLLIRKINREKEKIGVLQLGYKGEGLEEYMTLIGFPNFICCETRGKKEMTDFFTQYNNRHSIPLLQFPITKDVQSSEIREHFLQLLNDLICRITNIASTSKLKAPILYLLEELISNIVHHSNDDFGYVSAQYHPKNGYLDICIADIGRTILDSYTHFQNNVFGIKDHNNAILEAINGRSTKGGLDRGFGLSTSIKMLCSGLKGKFFLFSGNSFTIQTEFIADIINSDLQHMFWQGVLLCLRVPTKIPDDFQYEKYLE